MGPLIPAGHVDGSGHGYGYGYGSIYSNKRRRS